MQNDLMKLTTSSMLQKMAMEDTLKCNEFTQKFGLVLSEKQAMDLVLTRAKSLESCGRIEFGGGVVEKLIWTFYDSPYITPDNYTETIHELIECFYFYKNDTLDLCSDDEMIEFINSIMAVLKNRKYIGEYKYRDTVVPDVVPTIVDVELFNIVQERIQKNKRAPARSKAIVEYLLTTKLFCGKCGAIMAGESGTSVTGRLWKAKDLISAIFRLLFPNSLHTKPCAA